MEPTGFESVNSRLQPQENAVVTRIIRTQKMARFDVGKLSSAVNQCY